MIVKKDNKWLVMDSSGKKVLGTHYSKEEAKDQLAAIEISKKKQKQMKESSNFLNNSMTNLTEYYKNICEQLKAEILILEKKVKEEKEKKSTKSDKDYDGDGKVESKKDEYFGSKDKAIKKAMAKREGKNIKEAVTPLYNPKNDSAGLHPLLWSKETWAKDAAKARARLDAKKAKEGKTDQTSTEDIKTQAQANNLVSDINTAINSKDRVGFSTTDAADKFARAMKRGSETESVRASMDSGARRSVDSIMTRIGDKSPDMFADTKRTSGSIVRRGSEDIKRVETPDFADMSYDRGLSNLGNMNPALQKYTGTGGSPNLGDLIRDPNALRQFASDIVSTLGGGGLFKEDVNVQRAMNAIGGNCGLILPDIRDNGTIKNNSLVEATAQRLGKTKKMINEDASGIGLASLMGHPKAQEILNSTISANIEKTIIPLLNPQLEKLIQRHQDNPKLLEISSDFENLDSHHADLTKAMSIMEKQGLTTHPLYHSMDAVRMALSDAISSKAQRKDRYGQSLLGRSSLDRGI